MKKKKRWDSTTKRLIARISAVSVSTEEELGDVAALMAFADLQVYFVIKPLTSQRPFSAAKVKTAIDCHSFRALGITTYLENGRMLEKAQESPRTTKLYDRTTDQVMLDEVERIVV